MDFEKNKIKKSTSDLATKYADDLNRFELSSEMECFKHQTNAMVINRLHWLIY